VAFVADAHGSADLKIIKETKIKLPVLVVTI
jgi:hypothetical protein